MMVSTKGRYALRVLIDLAENGDGNYIPMKEIVERQNISLKYIERILPSLAKNKLIEGQHGKGGGYRLCRQPKEYTVGEILRLTDGDIIPVSCLECEGAYCDKSAECRTVSMWKQAAVLMNDYFDGITIADLMKK
jgi:Rrf2 family protein